MNTTTQVPPGFSLGSHRDDENDGGFSPRGATSLADLQAAESRLMLQTYARYPVQLVRGEGVHLFDENGTPYLDLLSGIGVSALGYGHPAITAAITAQAAMLIHTSNLFYHRGTTELALRLTEITGLDRVFL